MTTLNPGQVRWAGRLLYGLGWKLHVHVPRPSISCARWSHDIPRESLPISRFPVPEKDTLDLDIQDQMNEVEEKSGFLPNVFKAFSHRPEEFRAFFKYYDILMSKETGSLTKAEKELIVVATSAANSCLYCVVAHSAVFRIYSKRPYVADQVAANIEFADLSAREKAMLDFAMNVSQMKPIEEEQYTELAKHGIDEEDAWDIGAIASFFALSNRMAHLSKMRPNEEFYLMGRTKKKKEE